MQRKILICVYTSLDHAKLLPRFYETGIMQLLGNRPDIDIIEVYADSGIAVERLHAGKLTLKTNEEYSNLAAKSWRMVSFLVEHTDFDYLIKIDVTTLTTAIDNAIPTAGKLPDAEEISRLLLSDEFYSHQYNGFALHKAKQPGIENWAIKKGLSINYKRIFGDEAPPPFYSGKLYLLGRHFAEFIASDGEGTMNLFTQYLPAEDLMIGSLYQEFNKHTNSYDLIQ